MRDRMSSGTVQGEGADACVMTEGRAGRTLQEGYEAEDGGTGPSRLSGQVSLRAGESARERRMADGRCGSMQALGDWQVTAFIRAQTGNLMTQQFHCFACVLVGHLHMYTRILAAG